MLLYRLTAFNPIVNPLKTKSHKILYFSQLRLVDVPANRCSSSIEFGYNIDDEKFTHFTVASNVQPT